MQRNAQFCRVFGLQMGCRISASAAFSATKSFASPAPELVSQASPALSGWSDPVNLRPLDDGAAPPQFVGGGSR